MAIDPNDIMIFETQVASGADDVEEGPSGSVKVTSSDLELTTDGSKIQLIGIRFTDIDIPQGATIVDAYIQFQTEEASTGAVSLLIHGESSDDAAPFTGVRFDVSSRSLTNASVAWSPPDWTTRGEAGPNQRTADLAPIIQEIVDRDGWSALNDMVFIISGTGTRTAEAFEGKNAPRLHIEWVPGSDRVVFNDPPDIDSAANQIGELAASGTLVGITASATDPDAGDTVTYSIDDERFVIDADGVITRSEIGTLDFESEPSVTVTVTATSSDGSGAQQSFTIDLLDEPEPVIFSDPSDADGAANRIVATAASGTPVGITARAVDPDAGDSVTYSIDDDRFVIDPATGVITRSGTGALDAELEPSITLTVTATSTDGSVATQDYSVSVVDSAPPQIPTSVSLVRTTLASAWSPPSPDPSGIAYIAHLGVLMISDGEVNEMPNLFTGDNLFMMNPNGSFAGSLTAFHFSDEPTGVAYNPNNWHLFFTDDTGTRSVYELDPGPDKRYGTSDDVVTSFKTSAYGSKDPEGITYDANRGVLYIADGAGGRIYTIDPGANGKFDGVASAGGDDIVTSFDAEALGIRDPEGIEYDPGRDILYVTSTRNSIAMVTPTGELLGFLDISEAGARNPAGLALAPSSIDPTQMSLYLVDRGVDNDSNPNENDGKVYELITDQWLIA